MIEAVPGRRAGDRPGPPPVVTYRRLEPIHVFLVALWLAGCGLVLPQQRPAVLAMVVAAADGLVAFYLLGPAAAISVTPTHVVVDNPYVRHELPRVAIDGPPADGFWHQRLPLRSGGHVRLVALSLNLPRGYPDQLGRHDHRSLPAMMAKVPQQDGDAEIRSSPRWPNIGLALLAVATVVLVVGVWTASRTGAGMSGWLHRAGT